MEMGEGHSMFQQKGRVATMKRILAMTSALCLALCLTGTAFAQGNGPGYSRPGNGYGTMRTGQIGYGMTGRVGMGQTGYGMTGRVGVGQIVYSTGNTGTGVATGVQGSMRMGQTSGIFYSAANRAPVVPAGAIETGRTSLGTSTMVTYSMGGRLYHVTYGPNGTYTYTVTGAPMAISSNLGGTTGATTYARTGVSTTTTYGATAAGGATMLPRTGGGSGPGTPVLPVLLGFALIGLAAVVRRMSLEAR